MVIRKDGTRKYPKVERKHGDILGIKVSITQRSEVIKFVESRLDSKQKFYIVTPNPENLLLATKDWLLEKAIWRSDLSVPDGIGLAQAFTFLKHEDYKNDPLRIFKIFWQGMQVGYKTLTDKDSLTKNLPIIKGRELFFDLLEIADKRKLRVFLFGGEFGEQEEARDILAKKYTNAVFKTHHYSPQYNKNGQPASIGDRRMHKKIVGTIKLFEPDLIFVAMNTPKQEKWIYRNFFRITKANGAMTVGGTYNYVAGRMKIPPKWMTNLGLEWLYRLLQEPKRWKRIVNAIIVFPWRVFMWKLNPPRRENPNIKK
jgi:N-acetylglucosaminyldiphosphoundecaprenol N-acetyl-beta-D-mannosaminyltransferase